MNDVVHLKHVVNDGVYRENVGLITCDVTFLLDCELFLSLIVFIGPLVLK